MTRQKVKTDWKNGVIIHYYEDEGPSRAVPASPKGCHNAGGGRQYGGTKQPPGSFGRTHRETA